MRVCGRSELLLIGSTWREWKWRCQALACMASLGDLLHVSPLPDQGQRIISWHWSSKREVCMMLCGHRKLSCLEIRVTLVLFLMQVIMLVGTSTEYLLCKMWVSRGEGGTRLVSWC